MFQPTRLLVAVLLGVGTANCILAQSVSPGPAETAPTVAASATSERIRISAPSAVVQLRLEVYDEAGQKLFDTEQRGGNVLDWHLQNSSGERVADGSYLWVVTVKSLSGRFSQKLGLASVNAQSTTLRSATPSELNVRQAQAVGPIEAADEGLVVKSADDAQPVTVLAHTGEEAELTRTRGALSFRLGDFFSGNDKEQMRLTEEGNLGIGTAKPKVKLDVAGTIRAREGYAFADGSKLNVNDKGALTLTNSSGEIAPNIAGTGTQNQVAKWTDSSGTLGNSTITELNGKVGIGTNNPSGQLHIFGTATQDVFAGMGPDLAVGPAFNFGYAGGSFGRSAGFFNVRPDAGATAPNPSLRFATANVERMIVTNTGNIGIGTSGPGAKLDVAGNINTSTQYNIGGNRVFSIGVNGNTFAGVGTGAVNNGVSNSFFGTNAGVSNTTGCCNSFFGTSAGAANTGIFNSFFGNSAGQTNTTGFDNSFFGSGAGLSNTAGQDNSFFGVNAGKFNTGDFNSFFGSQAGGFDNLTGDNNAFFGYSAGLHNTSGFNNAFVGNTAGRLNSTGGNNSFFGDGAGSQNTIGGNNSFFGSRAGGNNSTGNKNIFIGDSSGFSNTVENNNTFIGAEVTGAAGITNATVIGYRAKVTQSNSLVLGGITVNGGTDTNVGIGTTAPQTKLHVQGGNIYVGGAGQGIILKSPDGSACSLLTIDNAGALVTSTIACP